jgi:hypothetical protein
MSGHPSDAKRHELLGKEQSERVAATEGGQAMTYSPRHDARLRALTARLHALGPRPLLELFCELLSGADLADRLEAYAAINPEILAALGGMSLPPPVQPVPDRNRSLS